MGVRGHLKFSIPIVLLHDIKLEMTYGN